MSQTLNRLLLFVLVGTLFSEANAQFRNDVPETRIKDAVARGQSRSLFSLLNSDKLSMHHSFSLGMASMGGFAMSYGTYTNSLNYLISDKWNLQSRIDLVQPGQTPLPQGVNAINPIFFYGAQLEYKPSENFSFSLSMDNYPRFQRQWRLSPYGLNSVPPR